MSNLNDDLRQQIADHRIVAIIGTGVTTAATNSQPCSSWHGLLHDGITRCVDLSRLSTNLADGLRAQVDSNDLDLLLSAAETVSVKLGAENNDGEYGLWLRESVGSLKAENKELLESLRDLDVILATTNYDGLLEEITGFPPVTWMESAKVERVLRGEDKAVLHLHGYWEKPESVILGIRSYERILGSEHAQTMQRAISSLKTILFVGFGDGLSDPNFGSLLDWTGKVFSQSEYRRFRLARESEQEKLQALHPPKQRIFVLSYGKNYDDLPKFLKSLTSEKTAPPPEPPAPPPPIQFAHLPARPRCFGRELEVNTVIDELLSDHPKPIPILGTAGIGKSTIALNAMHDELVVQKFGQRRFFIRCDGIKSKINLVAEIAQQIGIPITPNVEPALLNNLLGEPALLVIDNLETPWEAEQLLVEGLLAELAAVPDVALLISIRGNERPGNVNWRESICPKPLALLAARETFLAIAGNVFATDKRQDELLKEMDYLPLAITLLAHVAEGEPNLENVWERWQSEHTAMLHRAGGINPQTNIEVSYELSIKSPRMKSEGLRLLKLLSILPGGLENDFLSNLMHRDGLAASNSLRKLGLLQDDAKRLRLLAPLREYVRRKYRPENFDQKKLTNHFISFTSKLGNKIGKEGGAEAIQSLLPEVANIEEVLSEQLTQRDRDLSRAIEATLAWGVFILFTGVGTLKLLHQAAISSSKRGQLRNEANCLHSLGAVKSQRSEYEAATELYEEARQKYQKVGYEKGEANCLRSLGAVKSQRSEYEAATELYEEARQKYQKVGDELGEANCKYSYGKLLLKLFDYAEARINLEDALNLCLKVGQRLGEAECLFNLGRLAEAQNDFDKASEFFANSAEIFRQIDNPLWYHKVKLWLAKISEDEATKRQHLVDALSVRDRIAQIDLMLLLEEMHGKSDDVATLIAS